MLHILICFMYDFFNLCVSSINNTTNKKNNQYLERIILWLGMNMNVMG